MARPRPGHVVVIDDDARDRYWLENHFKAHYATVTAFNRAYEAVSYLATDLRLQHGLDLVMLDWKLTGGATTVLQAVRSSEPLRFTPVVIMSLSDHPGDMREAYEAGASAYIKKENDLAQLYSSLDSLHDFWFRASVTSPQPDDASPRVHAVTQPVPPRLRMPTDQSSHVLVITDDPHERDSYARAVTRNGGMASPFNTVDGAMSYLQDGPWQEVGLRLVLLDWSIPQTCETLLRAIRESTELHLTPVVAVTATHSGSLDAYCGGANASVWKQPDAQSAEQTLDSICHFWLQWNILPPPVLERAK